MRCIQDKPDGVDPGMLEAYTDSCWAQSLGSRTTIAGALIWNEGIRRVVREDNLAYIMAHSSSASKLAKLKKILGLTRLAKEEYERYMDEDVRTYRVAMKGGGMGARQVVGRIKSISVLKDGKK